MRDALKIVYVPIDDIRPNEYNPKQLTKKEARDLEDSIREFGMVDPLIVNSADNRKNVLIGGHQRLHVLKRLGKKEVPVVYVNISDTKKEQELCLRLSKNLGSWDFDLLANIDETLLSEIGFSQEEMDKIFQLDEKYNPELPITAKLYESYNYVLIYTTNIIDQTFLENFFQLQTHQSYRTKKQGVTRVVSFQNFLEALKRYKNENSNTV